MKKDKKDSKISIILFIIVLFVVTFLGSYLGNTYFDKLHSKKEKTEVKEKKEEKTIEELYAEQAKIEVAYKTESKTFVAQDGLFKISNSMHYPIQITIDEKAEKTMLKLLKDRIEGEFNNVNDIAKEQIDNYNKTFDPRFDGFPSPYGVSYAYSEDCITLKVITFALNTSGSMGGVSWESSRLYNYSIDTGEAITLDDVCIDVNKCKEVMYNFFIEELKKDARFPNLNADYEAVVRDKLFIDGAWGFADGIKMIIGKYDIASGAEGMFTYTIPIDNINEYLKDDYKLR